MGEALFGIKGKGFAVLAADRHTSYSIISVKDDEDKISQMDKYKIFACSGASADRNQFMEYIEKNIKLYELRNDVSLSTKAAANWTRNEMATALRKGPYNCDILIAGYDEATSDSSLYFLDSYASCIPLSKAAHGYAAYFCSGLLDRYWTPEITLDEALKLIKKCITELKVRFVLKLSEYIIKVVDKDGVRVINVADIP